MRVRCPQGVCEARNARRPEPERVPTSFVERYFRELEDMPGRAGPAERSLEIDWTEVQDPAKILERVLK